MARPELSYPSEQILRLSISCAGIASAVTLALLLSTPSLNRRVAPVDATARQDFERQTKVAVSAGISAYPLNSGCGALHDSAHDAEWREAELAHSGYHTVAWKDQEAAAAAGAAPPGEALRPDAIIRKFAANTSALKETLNHYSWRRTMKMEELTPNGVPQGGQWNEVADMIAAAGGHKEKIVSTSVPTFQHVILSVQDMQDLRDSPQLRLTTERIVSYRIDYKGREKVDEVGTYRFEVTPRQMIPGELYFRGTIWVEDRDLVIVKTLGKSTGRVQAGNEFPVFESYSEQVDGRNWFPTYRRADDTLRFPNGTHQRIRITVRCERYERTQ